MGGEALGVATHMGDLDALAALVDATVDRFGGVDIVINNAANALTQPLGEFTIDAWNKSYDVNLRGPVFLVQYALPAPDGEPARGGRQRALRRRVPRVVAQSMYSGAKAAMMAFTRAQAREWAPLGIRVNALAPGTIDTDMVRNNPPDAQAARWRRPAR